MAEHHGTTVPVIARSDQTVEIHWRLQDGTTMTERRTVPPAMAVEARRKPVDAAE